ncbi:transglutaminase-like domain-containing protein [Flavobacterium sp. LB1P71]|uniref:transglutaminase-like domain-containing protein n=1 Tax=unclassified Flavobacterium TaxID=196869 RepID=UPI003AAC102C
MSRSLIWYLRRHPLLYEVRFRLLSKNASVHRVENFCYNNINKTADIPEIYFELNPLIFEKTKGALSDIDKAKKIAIWLRNNTKGGPGLGKSSTLALKKMISGEGGVCSDFSQVFNNFCVINDLKVKEWGLKIQSNDPSIKGGHAFNEIYSKEFQKWILIDVAKSILFHPINPTIPSSVFDLIQSKKENKEIYFSSFNEKNTLDRKRITALYLTSNSYPFVITNYCNKTYDSYLNKLNFLPEPMIHGLLFFLGKSYVFEFPEYK